MNAIFLNLIFLIVTGWMLVIQTTWAIDDESLKTPYLEMEQHYNINNFGVNLDIAVSSKGDIYISSVSQAKLWILDRKTHRFSALEVHQNGLPKRLFPEALATDAQDHLWVTDKTSHRVQVLDRNGQFLQSYGDPEQPLVTPTAINPFNQGMAIWDRSSGTLWMLVQNKLQAQQLDATATQCVAASLNTAYCLQADGRELVKYQHEKVIARQIPAKDTYSKISDFELGREGNLLIVDSGEKNLLVLSSELKVQHQFDTYKSLLRKPTRLVLQDNKIWLIDEGRQELLQFDQRWAITGLEHALLGEEYLSVNLPEAALQEFDKAIKLGFREARIYLLKGKAQYYLKQYSEALNSFMQAKKEGADSDFWQGNTHFQLGQYEEALSFFKNLLATARIDKNIIRFNIAETFMALTRFADAEKMFRQVVQEEPNNSQARLGWARAMMALHRYADLIAQLNNLTSDQDVGRKARHYLGLAYMETGKFENALPLLERAAQEGPYFKEALQAMATLHRRLGSIKRAEHYENQLKTLKQQVDPLSTSYLLENEQ